VTTNPLELLLREHHGEMEEPLFSSQSDLARAIQKVRGLSLAKQKFESIRSFINQALSPNYSRTVSESLKTGIVKAVEKRVECETSVDFPSLKSRLLRSLSVMENNVLEVPVPLSSAPLSQLLHELAQANTAFYWRFNPFRFKNDWKEDWADHFCQVCETLYASEHQSRHVFVVSDQLEGERLWLDFYALVEEKWPGQASEMIMSLADSESIAIFKMKERDSFSFPMILIDPIRLTEAGYLLLPESQDSPLETKQGHIIRVIASEVTHWREHFIRGRFSEEYQGAYSVDWATVLGNDEFFLKPRETTLDAADRRDSEELEREERAEHVVNLNRRTRR